MTASSGGREDEERCIRDWLGLEDAHMHYISGGRKILALDRHMHTNHARQKYISRSA